MRPRIGIVLSVDVERGDVRLGVGLTRDKEVAVNLVGAAGSAQVECGYVIVFDGVARVGRGTGLVASFDTRRVV